MPYKATIIPTFDYYGTVFTKAFPLLAARGLPFTYFPATGVIDVGDDVQILSSDLKAMANAGNEIGVYSNAPLTTIAGTYGITIARDYMKGLKKQMGDLGFSVRSMAPNQRLWSSALRDSAAGIFDYVRAVDGTAEVWQTQPCLDTLYIANGVTASLGPSDDIPSLTAQLNSVIAAGGTWIPVIHKVADSADDAFTVATSVFTGLADAIAAAVAAGTARCVQISKINPPVPAG